MPLSIAAAELERMLRAYNAVNSENGVVDADSSST